LILVLGFRAHSNVSLIDYPSLQEETFHETERDRRIGSRTADPFAVEARWMAERPLRIFVSRSIVVQGRKSLREDYV
jgi:hypothetical protein